MMRSAHATQLYTGYTICIPIHVCSLISLDRLCDAYDIVCQKSATIARLELEKEELRVKLATVQEDTDGTVLGQSGYESSNNSSLTIEVEDLQDVIKKLQDDIKHLTEKASPDPPPQYEFGTVKASLIDFRFIFDLITLTGGKGIFYCFLHC